MDFRITASELYGWKPSLLEKSNLPLELIKWLRDKELTVRQAQDLLEVTKEVIERSWRTEKDNIRI